MSTGLTSMSPMVVNGLFAFGGGGGGVQSDFRVSLGRECRLKIVYCRRLPYIQCPFF